MQRQHFLLLGLAITIASHAQQADALAGSVHQGLWDLPQQPAAISTTAHRLEMNLFFGMADLDNSYFHLRPSGGPGLLRFDPRLRVDRSALPLEGLTGEQRSLDLNVRIMGPAVAVPLGQRTRVALHTALRVAGTTTDLDGLARLFSGEAFVVNTEAPRRMDELRIRTNQMAWAEAGITVARRFSLGKEVELHAALTGRYLAGLAAAAVRMDAPVVETSDEGATISAVNAAYAVHGTDLPRPGLLDIQGSGIGADAGVVLQWGQARGRHDSTAAAAPRWSIGMAVTDLGGLRMRNGLQGRVRNGRTSLDAMGDIAVDDPATLGSTLQQAFGADAVTVSTNATSLFLLPMAVRMHMDHRPVEHLAIRVAGTLGMDRGDQGVRTPSDIAFSVRYESRWIEVGVPVSFHQWQGMRVGMAVRLGLLMVGSDKVGALLGLANITGMDVYAGLKLGLGRR